MRKALFLILLLLMASPALALTSGLQAVVSTTYTAEADTTKPAFALAAVDETGLDLTVNWTEASNNTATGAGWNVSQMTVTGCTSDSSIGISAVASGSGTNTWHLTLDTAIQQADADTCKLNFDGGSTSIVDPSANFVDDFSNQSITNNSTQGGFPYYATSVTDAFGDTDTTPPMVGWEDIDNGWIESGGVSYPSAVGGSTSALDTLYGPDFEATIKISTLPGNGNTLDISFADNWLIYVRYTQVAGVANDTLQLFEWDYDETTNRLGSTYTFTTDPSAGDFIAISRSGTTVKVWSKAAAGSWVERISASQSFAAGLGNVVLNANTNTIRVDDLSVAGGTCTTSNDAYLFDNTALGGTGTNYIVSGYYNGTQFVANGTTVTGYEITVAEHTTNGNATAQLYTDSSDTVGSAISGTESQALSITGTGTKTFTLATPYTGLVRGTKYWLVVIPDGTLNTKMRANNASGYRWRHGLADYTANTSANVAVLGCAQ
jgi:hypothetical protein